MSQLASRNHKQKFTKLSASNSQQHLDRNYRKSLDMAYIQQMKIKQLNSQILKNEVDKIISKDLFVNDNNVNKSNDIVMKNQVHNQLNLQRKRYDEVKTIQNQKKNEIMTLKKDLDNLKMQESMLESAQMDYKSQVELLQKDIEKFRQKMENDMVQYEKRSQRLKLSMNITKKTLQKQQQESKGHNQAYMQGQNVLQQLLQNIQMNHDNRVRELEDLTNKLEFSFGMEEKKKQQLQKQNEVAEKAASDIKHENERLWRQLLLVQRLFYQILQIRQHKLIEYYSPYEKIFQKIKMTTGIIDSKEILNKIRNNESNYKNLTKQISLYDQQLNELNVEKNELEEKMAKLKNQCNGNDNVDNIEKKQNDRWFKEQKYEVNKQLSYIYDKEKNLVVINQKIRQFNTRMLNKMLLIGIEAKVIDKNDSFSQFELNMENFKENIQVINQEKFEMKDDMMKKMKKTTAGNESTIDNSILNKNMRVDMTALESIKDDNKEGISDMTEDQLEISERDYVKQMRMQARGNAQKAKKITVIKEQQ